MKQSGIYIITNTVNGKCYIGQSQDIDRRLRHHQGRLKAGKHANKHLQASVNKYGLESFEFSILEETNTLTDAEQFWIDYMKFIGSVLYNIRLASDSNKGMKYSEESKQKMSQWQIGKTVSQETRDNISRANTNPSKATRKKISNAAKGNTRWLGRKHTDETKAKLSEVGKGRRLPEETKQKCKDASRAYWASRKAA